VSDFDKKGHRVRAGRNAVSAVEFSQSLTAAVDAWAEAHHVNRSDAIRCLVELGLKAAPAENAHRAVQQHALEIEGNAVDVIGQLLDPSLSPKERDRRIRRLIEGPPEFTGQRRDLPKQGK
jgi:hypothetical protein